MRTRSSARTVVSFVLSAFVWARVDAFMRTAWTGVSYATHVAASLGVFLMAVVTLIATATLFLALLVIRSRGEAVHDATKPFDIEDATLHPRRRSVSGGSTVRP